MCINCIMNAEGLKDSNLRKLENITKNAKLNRD